MLKLHIFDQNHALTPLEKSQFFDFLNLSFLQSSKDFLFCKKLSNTFFFAYFAKNRNMLKLHIFDQNHRLTPLQKSQFFDFLNFSLQCLGIMFLFLKYCQTHFLPYFEKNKNMATFYIFDQNHGLTLWKTPNFSIFLTARFYGLESIFCF